MINSENNRKIYEILDKAFMRVISKKEAIEILENNIKMNGGSAKILTEIFPKLFKGEEFKRTLNAQLLDDLLNNLLNDYGKERLGVVLLGLKKHIDYRQLKKKSKLGIVYQKYRDMVGENDIFDDFQKHIEEAENDDLQKIQAWINGRKNQTKFKSNLLKKYNSQCLISQTKILELIEAAHIFPHSKSGMNNIENGILLRSDLHILFDRYLLSINPKNYKVIVDDSLKETEYWKYHNLDVDLCEESKDFLYLRQSYSIKK